MLPRFQAYCTSLEDFKRNHFSRPLAPELAAEVERRWGDSYAALGYQKGDGSNKKPIP